MQYLLQLQASVNTYHLHMSLYIHQNGLLVWLKLRIQIIEKGDLLSHCLHYQLSLKPCYFFKKIFIYVFIYFGCTRSSLRHVGSPLRHVGFLVAACGLLVAACMWDLVPQRGIKPGPPALGVWSLTHWTTREVPKALLLKAWSAGQELWQLFGTCQKSDI